MAEPLELTDVNFQTEALQSDIPVLVDFWAVWCGPCRTMTPIVDELASTLHGKAKICKLDVDNAQDIAANLGIRSIPTIIIFDKGEEVERIVGIVSKQELINRLDKYTN